MTDVSAFQLESYRIDQQIWDTIALQPNERALFLGLTNEGAWVRRAVEIGVDVTSIGGDDEVVAKVEKLGATAIRGSATMIPASENAYDVAVAMHYLHEIDPGFHAQVVSELARVARRVVIVEPSPPADALGKRIAALYGRAKRDAGLFESYQPLDYWRKLLSIVKADVWQQLITFTRIPPRYAVYETISLILDALAIEEMPERYLDELRALAARPDAQLLPLSRIVLVGTAAGEALAKSSPQLFRPNAPTSLSAPKSAPVPASATAQSPPQQLAPAFTPPQAQPQPAWTPTGFGFGSEPEAPEFPPPPPPPQAPVQSPPAPQAAPSRPAAPPPAAQPKQPAPQPQPAPFGTPFSLPDEEDPPFGGVAQADTKTGFGWSWEPPDDPAV